MKSQDPIKRRGERGPIRFLLQGGDCPWCTHDTHMFPLSLVNEVGYPEVTKRLFGKLSDLKGVWPHQLKTFLLEVEAFCLWTKKYCTSNGPPAPHRRGMFILAEMYGWEAAVGGSDYRWEKDLNCYSWERGLSEAKVCLLKVCHNDTKATNIPSKVSTNKVQTPATEQYCWIYVGAVDNDGWIGLSKRLFTFLQSFISNETGAHCCTYASLLTPTRHSTFSAFPSQSVRLIDLTVHHHN